jgi:hypothetical protein
VIEPRHRVDCAYTQLFFGELVVKVVDFDLGSPYVSALGVSKDRVTGIAPGLTVVSRVRLLASAGVVWILLQRHQSITPAAKGVQGQTETYNESPRTYREPIP